MNTVFALALLLSAAPIRSGDDARHALEVAPESRLEVEAFWKPVTDWLQNQKDVGASPALLGIEPAEKVRRYRGTDFAPFLPEHPVAVGDVWEVDRDAILAFLTQFHPGATARLHHEPVAIPGSHAVLRAISNDHAEILTRSHAQIVMDDGDLHYTPAQFEGRLLLERASGEVVAYSLHVPVRNTNLDINLQTEETRNRGGSFGVMDMGLIPQMELAGGEAPDVAWDEEVALEEARVTLRNQYYGAIDWLPLAEAVETAQMQDKPLHVIVILGTLDDESC